MNKAIVVLAAAILSGCTATYTQKIVLKPSNSLNVNASVLISIPKDGAYGDEKYESSGEMTANEIKAAFDRHATEVKIASDCGNLSCLRSDKSGVFTYFVTPEILHWEDRATEWSGKPDRLTVKVSIYDKTSDTPKASAIITGKSKWLTFGGDHPQDLLPEPLEKYIDSLYR